jgi:hypothetical protein
MELDGAGDEHHRETLLCRDMRASRDGIAPCELGEVTLAYIIIAR